MKVPTRARSHRVGRPHELKAEKAQSRDGRVSRISGAVRGAEHRRRGGKMPVGSRRWIAAIAKQYRDVLSERPRHGEKRRAFRFADANRNTAVGA